MPTQAPGIIRVNMDDESLQDRAYFDTILLAMNAVPLVIPFLQQLIVFKGARRVPILKGLLALLNGKAEVDGDEASSDVETDECEVKAGNREEEAEEIVALLSKYQDAQVVIVYKMYNEMRARGAGETEGKGNGKEVQGKAVVSRSVAVVLVI